MRISKIGREHGPMVCIGHRGAKGHEAENTLRSFRAAVSFGCPWVETDVWQVEDELLVFHDRRLERCTNGRGRLLNYPLKTLRSLNAGKGEKIPFLTEVLGLLDGRTGLNIEIKGPRVVASLTRILAERFESGLDPEMILVSSFDHVQLAAFHLVMPEVPVAPLVYGFPGDYARCAEELGAVSMNVSLDYVDSKFVEDAHRRGLKVLVYTVNEPDDIEEMDALGVDGVFSDFPDRVYEYLRAKE